MVGKIGIISDVHARPEPVRQALAIFRREGVNEIICAGDIAGYYDDLEQTIALLKHAQCKTVRGNHDQDFLDAHPESKSPATTWLQTLPLKLVLHFAGRTIYVVHAQPPEMLHGGIKLLDQQGDVVPQKRQHWQAALDNFGYDILIVGHTHQVIAEQLGDTFLINPGSTAFNHSCMVLDAVAMTLKTFALENQAIVRCWNFSMLYNSAKEYPTKSNI